MYAQGFVLSRCPWFAYAISKFPASRLTLINRMQLHRKNKGTSMSTEASGVASASEMFGFLYL
jgi:hypothetical protein